MTNKKALITGVNGQDGSYLAELLLEKGYSVVGTIRRSSTFITERIEHLFEDKNFKTTFSDLSDSSNLYTLISKYKPDEIYNLAAQSHVAVSFEVPEYTADVTGIGPIRILSAIKELNPEIKFYQASTSELFGGEIGQAPQSELTRFNPRSPYATAKLYSYWITKNYRESYDLFASNGILFNHESPRRGGTFVTRKIAIGIAKFLKTGEPLILGNLDAVRDWGHARDYVDAMWRILQHSAPDDFVIATGYGASVREFVTKAFAVANLKIEWEGKGISEIGVTNNKVAVKIDERYFRPLEVDVLIGDASKAKNLLDWSPKISLDDLIIEMVESELNVR